MRFFVDEMPKTQDECIFAVKDKLPLMTTSGKGCVWLPVCVLMEKNVILLVQDVID
jgi:hypothetical protein